MMAGRWVAGGFCSRLSRLSSFPISAARRASAVARCPVAASRFLSPSRVLSRPLPLAPCRGVSFNVQDSEDFTERVINSDVPVLVDFHAQWCGPCKILGPRLEKVVAKQQGRIVMAKVDIDEHTDLAIEYGVSAVPTVIAMRAGKVLDQFVGIKDEDQLDSFIGKLVGL
ncbi:thioredoxin, mitochondrial-like [Brienomyrus brachyistius]|uniref:thioredoxin, mitochondrial-like n=1 Tax=Brienomyrus brachyistius TaxID=42636 RepID=UPI0020B37F0D|nr:thioredoxin, mitochondrial-like [Brienomyrus brachyistius]